MSLLEVCSETRPQYSAYTLHVPNIPAEARYHPLRLPTDEGMCAPQFGPAQNKRNSPRKVYRFWRDVGKRGTQCVQQLESTFDHILSIQSLLSTAVYFPCVSEFPIYLRNRHTTRVHLSQYLGIMEKSAEASGLLVFALRHTNFPSN